MNKILVSLLIGVLATNCWSMDLEKFNAGTAVRDWFNDFPLENTGTLKKTEDRLTLTLTEPNQCSRWKCNVEGLPANELMYFSFYCEGRNVQSSEAGFRSYVRNRSLKYVTSFSPAGNWKWTTGDFKKTFVEGHFRVPADGKAEIVFELRGDAGEVLVSAPMLSKRKRADRNDKSPVKLSVLPTQWMKHTVGVLQDLPTGMKISISADGEAWSGKDILFRINHPDFIKISCFEYKRPAKKNGLLYYPLLEQVKSGKGFSVFRLPQSMIKQLKVNSVLWNNELYLFLQSTSDLAAKGKMSFQILDGTRELARYDFEAISAGSLPTGRKPARKFKTVVGYPHSAESSEPTIRRSYAKFWNSIAERPEAHIPVWFEQLPPDIQNEFRAAYVPGIMISATDSIPIFRTMKQVDWRKFPKMLDSTGKEVKKGTIIVPAFRYVLEDPDHFIWDKALKEEVLYRSANLPVKFLNYDFEPFLMRNGYCEENRKWFAEWAKLPQVPPIQDITQKYNEKWAEFRRYENELMVQKFAASMKKHFPEIEFRYCSDPIEPDGGLSQWCGTDPKLSDHVIQVYQMMPYFSGTRFYDTIKKNMEVLKGKQYPLIDPSEFEAQFFLKYTPEKTAQNIIASAVLGNIGIGFWRRDVFDGRYLVEIARAFSAVAEIEDLLGCENAAPGFTATAENCLKSTIADGVTREYPALTDKMRYSFHKKGNAAVAGIMNYNESDAVIVKCKFPDVGSGLLEVVDVFSQKGYGTFSAKDLQAGILAEIPKNGTLVLRVDPAGKPAKSDISQDQLRKALEKQLAELSEKYTLDDLKSGKLGIRWIVLKEGKTTCIELSCGSRIVLVKPDNGEVVAVSNEVGSSAIRSFGDVILENSELEKSPQYQLKSTEIKDGKARIVFQADIRKEDSTNPYGFQLDGLRIVKSYALDENGLVFSLEFENRNLANESCRVQARIRSQLSPVGIEGIPSGLSQEMFLVPGRKIDFPWARRLTPIDWTSRNILFSDGMRYKLGAGFIGAYFYRNLKLVTAEPITERFILTQGGKKSFDIKIVF